jgi:hypothetical protein
MRSALAAAAVLVVLTAVASISAAPAPSLPRVTIIADSAFAAVTGNQEPLAVVKSGFTVDIDVGICRRLTRTSCPSDAGVAPPTLVDVVHSLGPAPKSSPTSSGVSQGTKIDIDGVKPKPWATGLSKAMKGRFASVNLIVCPGRPGGSPW